MLCQLTAEATNNAVRASVKSDKTAIHLQSSQICHAPAITALPDKGITMHAEFSLELMAHGAWSPHLYGLGFIYLFGIFTFGYLIGTLNKNWITSK